MRLRRLFRSTSGRNCNTVRRLGFHSSAIAMPYGVLVRRLVVIARLPSVIAMQFGVFMLLQCCTTPWHPVLGYCDAVRRPCPAPCYCTTVLGHCRAVLRLLGVAILYYCLASIPRLLRCCTMSSFGAFPAFHPRTWSLQRGSSSSCYFMPIQFRYSRLRHLCKDTKATVWLRIAVSVPLSAPSRVAWLCPCGRPLAIARFGAHVDSGYCARCHYGIWRSTMSWTRLPTCCTSRIVSTLDVTSAVRAMSTSKPWRAAWATECGPTAIFIAVCRVTRPIFPQPLRNLPMRPFAHRSAYNRSHSG